MVILRRVFPPSWVISESLKWQNGDGGESVIFEMFRFQNIENIQFEVVRVKKYENKNSDFDSPSKSKFLSVLEVNSLSCPFLTIFTKLRFSNESFWLKYPTQKICTTKECSDSDAIKSNILKNEKNTIVQNRFVSAIQTYSLFVLSSKASDYSEPGLFNYTTNIRIWFGTFIYRDENHQLLSNS